MATVVLVLRLAASTTWQLLPYLLLGVLASEGLRYTQVSPLLERGCRSHPAIAIPLSALLGIVSPLCTYGTVPVVLQLLRAGVPVAPLATFLSASSLMNPQLLLLTWGGLGPAMALGRLLAVFAFGLALGAVMHFLPVRFIVRPAPPATEAPPAKERPRFTWKGFAKNCWKMLEFVGFYVILGALLGAIVEVLVPGRWIMAVFGSRGWYHVLLAALLGVPLSACGGGVIPLVRGLVEQGMSAGAALAFLIAGPATRIPPLMALATIVRPLFVIGYVVFLLLYSVAAGLLYGMS
jgi:uncharacterized protein